MWYLDCFLSSSPVPNQLSSIKYNNSELLYYYAIYLFYTDNRGSSALTISSTLLSSLYIFFNYYVPCSSPLCCLLTGIFGLNLLLFRGSSCTSCDPSPVVTSC